MWATNQYMVLFRIQRGEEFWDSWGGMVGGLGGIKIFELVAPAARLVLSSCFCFFRCQWDLHGVTTAMYGLDWVYDRRIMLVFCTGYTTASLDHKLLHDAYFVTLRVSEMERTGYMFPWLVDMLAATVLGEYRASRKKTPSPDVRRGCTPRTCPIISYMEHILYCTQLTAEANFIVWRIIVYMKPSRCCYIDTHQKKKASSAHRSHAISYALPHLFPLQHILDILLPLALGPGTPIWRKRRRHLHLLRALLPQLLQPPLLLDIRHPPLLEVLDPGGCAVALEVVALAGTRAPRRGGVLVGVEDVVGVEAGKVCVAGGPADRALLARGYGRAGADLVAARG